MTKTVNVREFVELLGGNDSASKLFGVTVPAICNWKKDNRLPGWAIMQASRYAEDNGVALGSRCVKIKRPTGARMAAAE
jgi:hypothetical protein